MFSQLGATVEPVTPLFDPRRLWEAWLTLRGFAITGRLGALVADPAKRPLIKPEAVWEVESAADLTAADVLAASTVRSEWYACTVELFRRFDALVSRVRRFSRSMPTGPGPAKWQGELCRLTINGWKL